MRMDILCFVHIDDLNGGTTLWTNAASSISPAHALKCWTDPKEEWLTVSFKVTKGDSEVLGLWMRADHLGIELHVL